MLGRATARRGRTRFAEAINVAELRKKKKKEDQLDPQMSKRKSREIEPHTINVFVLSYTVGRISFYIIRCYWSQAW